jgi:hypothetical protein
MDGYEVRKINRNDCSEFILNIHYAKRWPSISYSFGLFQSSQLVGVVTYGTPPSAPLKRGVAGDQYKANVIELNRLCLLNNKKNEASFLVGKSLRMIEGDKIIISFADTDQGHKGYVYQACNFTYHGLSAKRTDWKVKGKEHLHGQTIADEFRGVKNRAEAMRNKYGDDFYLKQRPRKHRYIYIIGSKLFKRKVKECIKYKTESYPKE